MSPPSDTTAAEAPALVPLRGWGRASTVWAEERRSEDLGAAAAGASLTRGLGRSYGDASLPAARGARVASSLLANRLLAFDAERGVLRAEAGASLAELEPLLLRRGWFPPVVPGTQFVTLGGLVAADVHGKSHHRSGSFGRHVRELVLLLADGRRVACGPEREPELFEATLGGMGLSGHILEVELALERIPSPWMWQRTERAPNLEGLLRALREAGRAWPFTVAWCDALATGRHFGRGVVFATRWAEPREAPGAPPAPRPRLGLPFGTPGWLLQRPLGRLANAGYRTLQRPGEGIVHPETSFHPLDVATGWNRVYGSAGFTQIQCVLPYESGDAGVARVFELVRDAGGLPMLCVVKDLGDEGVGRLSFPRPGITLNIDLPVRAGTQRAMDRVNEHLIREGGRIYLAKDALTRAEHFAAMEPRLPAWNELRRKYDPEGRLRSALSVRLLGDEA